MANSKEGRGNVECSHLPDLKHLIMFDDVGNPLRWVVGRRNTVKHYFSGAWRFNDVLDCGGSIDENVLEERRRKAQFDDPANIEFTSGTTGKSKAVRMQNLISNFNMQRLFFPTTTL